MPMDFKSNTVVIPNRKIAFFITEKVASSSQKAALRLTFAKPGQYGKEWPKVRDRITHLGPCLSLPGWADYWRGAVVRNPWDRLASAWTNKITPKAVLLKELDSQSYFKPGETFRDFVMKVCDRDDNHLDRHLHPQLTRMFEGSVLLPNRFFTFEDLKTNWQTIQDEIFTHTDGKVIIADLPNKNVSSPSKKNEVQWDGELIDMVVRRYERDFRILRHYGIDYQGPREKPCP